MMEMEPKHINLGADVIAIVVLLIFAGALMLIPNNSRDLLIGSEPYYNLRIAEAPFTNFDDLSYSGRFQIFNAWPLLLNVFSRVSGVSIIQTSIVLPFIFALSSMVIFYLLLRKLKIGFRIRALATLILGLSPGLIYLGSVSTDAVLPLFLLLSSALLFLNKRKIYASVLLLLMPFFGFLQGLIALLFVLIFGYKYKFKQYYFIVLVLLFMILWPLLIYGFPSFEFGSLTELVSDFGGSFGISMFAIFLLLFGIARLWEKKYRNFSIYLLFIFLLILTIFNTKALLYLNFLVAFLAAFGLIKLVSRKWESNIIKTLSLIIISVGIVFSTITYLGTFPDQLPDADTKEALKFIKDNSEEGDVVFSHFTKGHWISSIAERKNYMDDLFFYSPDLEQRKKDFDTLIQTKELDEAILIINKYNLKYIYIDPEMRSSLWSKDDDGLLFLLKVSKKFKKIYNKNNYEVYEII